MKMTKNDIREEKCYNLFLFFDAQELRASNDLLRLWNIFQEYAKIKHDQPAKASRLLRLVELWLRILKRRKLKNGK